MLPIKNRPITTPYGVKGSRWAGGVHKGVDQACPDGTPVYSPVTGTVVGVNQAWGPAFGSHQVIIKFRARRRKIYPVRTYYVICAHMSAENVKVGQTVKLGQLIGKSGHEGNVTGPHMHMEVQTAARWSRTGHVNPDFVINMK